MSITQIALPAAFFAGAASFLSPAVPAAGSGAGLPAARTTDPPLSTAA